MRGCPSSFITFEEKFRMRKIIFVISILVLTGCAAIPTALTADQNNPTPIVVVQTVLVTPPSDTSQLNTATEAPAQALVTQQSQVFGTQPAVIPVTGPIAIPASFNGKGFTNLGVSGDKFSLRCEPKQISFDATTSDVYITQVDLYWRLRDKHSTFVPNWSWGRTLETDGLYHFWITISGSDIASDLRKHQAWFDFEFVGMNKTGDAMGRTEKITNLVSYTIDC